MDSRAIAFRRAVSAQNGPGRARRRFGPELRAQAREYAKAQRAAGQSWESISKALAVDAGLLQKWCAAGVRSKRPDFVRVEVETAGSSSAAGLRLVTAAGDEVYGLDVDGAARLLRLLR